MTNNRLWETLSGYLPADHTPIVERAIRATENLPGLTNWTPVAPLIDGMIPREVFWGFPFTFLSDISSLDPIRRRIGALITNKQEPTRTSDWAEVSAAALVRALGARTLQRIEEAESPTPDFHVWWGDDLVEMEVTRPDPKKSQTERSAAATRMAHEITSFGRRCDLVIHIADILRDEDCQQVLHAAHDLEPGKERESQGRWRVRAEAPNRAANCHVIGGHSDAAPAWWPQEDVVRLFSLNQHVGGPEPSHIQPQVRIQFGTPVMGYINAAARKADCFQGSGDVPFLIAVNTMALPGAFEILTSELPEYYKAWPRISGVLLIHGPAFIGLQLGWIWRLIRNPDARNKLPEQVSASTGAEQGTQAYDLRFSTAQGIVTPL
jgi:hypothetical protein